MPNGLILLIFFVLVLLLVLLGAIITFNFLRYRFQGDHTIRFLTLYGIAFVTILLLSLAMIRWTDPSLPPSNEINGFTF